MSMAGKQCLLHELLRKEQEAFCLRSYIADRRSHSPAKTHPVSNDEGVSLQIPSPLVEAAMRIQKYRARRGSGFALFDSLLKRFRSLRGNRKREKDSWKTAVAQDEGHSGCSDKKVILRGCSKFMAEENAADFVIISRFYISPFLHTGDSPETGNCKLANSKKDTREEEYDDDEKEQTSPVSVLEPPFSPDIVHENYGLDINNSKSFNGIARHETTLGRVDGIATQTNDEQKQSSETLIEVEDKDTIDITEAMSVFDSIYGEGHGKHVEEIAGEVALAIFELLVEEECVVSTCN